MYMSRGCKEFFFWLPPFPNSGTSPDTIPRKNKNHLFVQFGEGGDDQRKRLKKNILFVRSFRYTAVGLSCVTLADSKVSFNSEPNSYCQWVVRCLPWMLEVVVVWMKKFLFYFFCQKNFKTPNPRPPTPPLIFFLCRRSWKLLLLKWWKFKRKNFKISNPTSPPPPPPPFLFWIFVM